MTPDDKLKMEKQFCQLQKAKEILTDDLLRKDYDKYLQSGLTISYEKWRKIVKDCSHNSIHWCNSNRNAPRALTQSFVGNFPDNVWDNSKKDDKLETWRQSSKQSNDLLNKFRNYQI